jgi:hypothetical protein
MLQHEDRDMMMAFQLCAPVLELSAAGAGEA